MRSFYLWVAIASLFVLGLTDSARGPVYPDLLQTFGLSDTSGSLFFFATSFCGFLTNLAAGHWLPRLGPYRALQAFLGVQIVSLVMLTWAPNFYWLLGGAAIFGVALSGMGTTQNIIVAQTAEARYVRRAFSLLHCMYGGASFVAPLLVSAVYRANFEWRTSFLAMAIFPAFLLIVSFSKTKDSAPSLRKVRDKRGTNFNGEQKRLIYWICALVIGYVFAELILSTRLVLYMRRELSYSAESANAYLAGFFGLMLTGRIAFAFLNIRIPTLRLLRVSAAGSLFLFGLGIAHHPLWLVLCGLLMAPFFPCLMTFVQEHFPETEGERAFAWVFTAHALGIMSMHIVTGWFSDSIGLKFALYFGPVALGTILIFLLNQPVFSWRNDDSPR